jgi:transcriptional regulator with XRE-family HTH domain
LGISKEALREVSGVDRGTQLAFEMGKRPVSPATIRKLTRGLDRLEREKLAAEAQEPGAHLGDVIGTTQAGEPIVEYTVELPDGTTVKASVKGEVNFDEFAARVAELVARLKP